MAWLKRNLLIVVVIFMAFCSVTALSLETACNTGALARLFVGGNAGGSPAVPGKADSGSPAVPTPADQKSPAADNTAGGFLNRAMPANEPVKAWERGSDLSRYDFDLSLDPKEKQLRGTLDFTYVNAEAEPMSELHFLLYANSYGKLQYGIFESDELGQAYPEGFSPGSIDILGVTCAGFKTDYYLEGTQNQVLRVRLPQAVAPGGTARLTIKYTVTIPNCFGRFGYGDDTMSLVNCNPILAVYDSGKWFDYPYYAIGDPFYSETADYHATITAPADWTIAATGVLTEKPQGSDNVWTVDAPARRDFGFVASDRFEVMQADADGVLVRSYYLRGDSKGGKEALDTGVEAMRTYGELFGQYPYSEYSVVEADFFIGGMEYPGMVLIDDSLYRAASVADRTMFDVVVAHETSHQWWYSTVGDNEVMEPWLDEGLAEFTTRYFFEKNRGGDYNAVYNQYNLYYKDLRGGQQGEYAATLPVFRYDGNESYSAWVYNRTADVMQELRERMGDDKFFSALRAYYMDHRLGITTRKDLEKAFEDVWGGDLTPWFEQEFNTP